MYCDVYINGTLAQVKTPITRAEALELAERVSGVRYPTKTSEVRYQVAGAPKISVWGELRRGERLGLQEGMSLVVQKKASPQN